MKTRTLSVWMLALALAAGCDSGGDDGSEPPASSDAERFVGTWAVTGVTDDSGSQMATFTATFNSVRVAFRADGTYVLTVDARDDAQDATLEGPYSVNETTKQVTLSVAFAGQTIPVAFAYAFEGNARVVLSTSSALVNPLLGTSLQGLVGLTLTKE